MQTLLALCARIDRLSRFLGRFSARLLLLMLCLQIVTILGRHGFGKGFLYAQDSVIHLFALTLLAGIGWLAAEDGHVRVDVVRQRLSADTCRWIDILGIIMLWLPFAGTLFALSLPYASASWAVLEGSRDRSGMNVLFLLKSAPPLFAALLFLQGATRLCQKLSLRSSPHDAGQ